MLLGSSVDDSQRHNATEGLARTFCLPRTVRICLECAIGAAFQDRVCQQGCCAGLARFLQVALCYRNLQPFELPSTCTRQEVDAMYQVLLCAALFSPAQAPCDAPCASCCANKSVCVKEPTIVKKTHILYSVKCSEFCYPRQLW